MHGGQIRKRRLYCQRSRPVPKAVFRAGRGGQWVHYFVALVRESKAIIGAAEMRKCLDKIFDLAIDERLK